MTLHALEKLGWDCEWAELAARVHSKGQLGRVIEAGRSLLVQTECCAVLADVRLNESERAGERPVCGDWVIVQEIPASGEAPPRGLIRAVLPRRTAVTRRKGDSGSQTLVANVDAVWIICGLDRDQGLRSLQRYQLLTRVPGIDAVVVLNKVDMIDDIEDPMRTAQRLAPNSPVIATSCASGLGLAQLREQMVGGRTIALLGPSGVGKSSLVNTLVSTDVQSVGEVRARDCRGRHTTSAARLTPTSGMAQLIDTPGLRELGFWHSRTSLTAFFGDIEALAQCCRFSDCQHRSEPGCAVRAAIEAGTLDTDRYLSFLELSEECCDP